MLKLCIPQFYIFILCAHLYVCVSARAWVCVCVRVQLVSNFQTEAALRKQEAETAKAKLASVRKLIAKLLKSTNEVRVGGLAAALSFFCLPAICGLTCLSSEHFLGLGSLLDIVASALSLLIYHPPHIVFSLNWLIAVFFLLQQVYPGAVNLSLSLCACVYLHLTTNFLAVHFSSALFD